MRSHLAAFALAVALSIMPDVTAAQSTIQQKCWPTGALAGRDGEKKIVKGDRRFDTPPELSGLAAAYPIPPGLRGAIRRVKLPPGKKLVALTFDMCELPGEITGYDGTLIDFLRAQGIKATLFASGKWMRSHPERTEQLIADPLFEMANHAEAHRNLRLIAGDVLKTEILGPQIAYETARSRLAKAQCVRGLEQDLAAIPARMGLFRFPFGACNQPALDAVNDAGLLAIQWDLSTGDPTPAQSARAIADAIIRHTKPGSIIIGHGNGRGFHTAEGVALALPALKNAGYEFVTVSELLAAGTPEISATCYDARPGDTDKYDTFFKPRPPQTIKKPAAELKDVASPPATADR